MNLLKALLLLMVISFLVSGYSKKPSKNRIMPWAENQWFWQFKGKPLMLLGASSDDNLFQWPSEMLIPHLDSMKSVGANYVRNTMSDRQDKKFEYYPFKKLDTGKYDMNQWNEAYWKRFEFFLKETAKRNIIVQIEVWDRFDYSRNNWPSHPYRPQNNINYSEEESDLASDYPLHPGQNKQPFFFTTPLQQDNKVVLKYQKRFVEKMLSYSLDFDHVLYCMDNETSAEEQWGIYWAELILAIAKEEGKEICVTEMWDNWNLTTEQHKRTFDHPERYVFCDVSQNNQQKGQKHWDNFQWVRTYLSTKPRPLNTVKTYGLDGGVHGITKDGLERWWRHVIGGAASARFHRPDSGLGLSELSMASVKAVRELEKTVKLWELLPGNELLSSREENEAYLSSKTGETYILFFTNGGEVSLDLSAAKSGFKLKWMDIRKGNWASESKIKGGEKVSIKAPGELEWVAVISKI